MKFWEYVIEAGVSCEEACEYIYNYPKTSFITRPEWKGIHFVSGDKYYILLEDGEVKEVEIEDVWCQNKHDWLIITITQEAEELLKAQGLI